MFIGVSKRVTVRRGSFLALMGKALWLLVVIVIVVFMVNALNSM